MVVTCPITSLSLLNAALYSSNSLYVPPVHRESLPDEAIRVFSSPLIVADNS